MKSLFLSWLTLSVLCSACIDEPLGAGGEAGAEIVGVGDSLPSFCVTTDRGDTVCADALRGQPTVLVFFHTSCGDCRCELPHVDALYKEYAREVQFLCVGRNQSRDAAAAYWREAALTLPRATDEGREVYDQFARRTIPRVYVSDATGVVRAVFVESVDEDSLRATLQRLL